jgi:hypothetical protein
MIDWLEQHYQEIWLVDFEYGSAPGELPEVRCMVARELFSNRLIRLWEDQLKVLPQPPFRTDRRTLFVAYLASAELGCFHVLGWHPPERILDLYVEFKRITSGRKLSSGRGLIGALSYFGIASLEAAEKDGMRELALRGGVYTKDERADLLDYCQSDVDSLVKLLPAFGSSIDLPRALLRGRYMVAVASMEAAGVPIDTKTLSKIQRDWDSIKNDVVNKLDANIGVYEGTSFKTQKFVDYLNRQRIAWPLLDSGSPALDDSTFRYMAAAYPEKIGPIRELREALSSLRLNNLSVGNDGRNRCMLSPFMSRTGRNQPSNTRFIFGPSAWLRGLIRPTKDRAIAYIDYEQQEFALAAALSGDKAMMEAYKSGDPYLTFAKQAGAVPDDATKQSHKSERDRFKVCALAVQYGMGANSLAQKLGETKHRGKELLRLHKATYPKYWTWSDAVEASAILGGKLTSVFGWEVHAGGDANPRSLRNFPLQANGAEMLRLACCMATESGVTVCAPVHDALLIEGASDEIDDLVARTQAIMTQASILVTPGFPLRTDFEVVRWPDRYMDPRGSRMWRTVMTAINNFYPNQAG